MNHAAFSRLCTFLRACPGLAARPRRERHAFALLPALVLAAGCAGAAEPIRLGVVLSLTGPGAATGIPDRDGLLLAQKAINARGGVNGQPIELVIEDDASQAPVAVRKTQELIEGKKARLILGPNLIGSTMAMGEVTERLSVPLISFTGINMAVEGNRKCVFHTLPPQDLNAHALLAYAKNALGSRRIGILHDAGYGQVITNALKPLAAGYGVEFVSIEKFEIGATDVTPHAARVKAAKPDAVFVIALSAAPFKAVKQVELHVPMVAAVASATYATVKAMGPAADNIRFAEFVVGEDPLPHQGAFIQAFEQEYGRMPKSFEAAAWDGLHVAARALAQAGAAAAPAKLCEAVRQPYQGALANFDFGAPDQTGLTLKSIVYSKVTQGRFSRLPFRNK